ncbi:MAG: hypothetical protein HY288_09140 [Planctomycetia bacterium]|nr:hypothetical protein [Planctomycetia bacterium]
MTMVHQLRGQAPRLARVASAMIVVVLMGTGLAASLRAEAPPVHYNHAGIMPPGAIGSQQLLRGGPLPGYFQPVEIHAPPGALISTALAGEFEPPRDSPLLAGMLIGSVYRLRVTNIPQQEGMEVYPTIEVIDRIYPPVGQEFRFPIPIELTQEELEMALAGKFVTRVIYLEEPAAALPAVENPNRQSYFEAGEGENPLEVADSLGRPMAILRMGARVPDAEGPDETFMYGSPPLLKWKPAAAPVMAAKPLRRGGAKVKQASDASRMRKPIWRGPTTP